MLTARQAISVGKMMKTAKGRNKEIFETKGDIDKFDINFLDCCKAIEGSDADLGATSASLKSAQRNSAKSDLAVVRGFYTHFKMHKKKYIDAFKQDNTALTGVYVSGTWLMISYLAATCVYITNPGSAHNPHMKYGKMVSDLQKVIGHPKYINYLSEADEVKVQTEALLFEGVFAVGAALVSMIVLIRLIIWNIYTMRTTLSDKLKVTAEFMERNVNRLKNKDMKNKDKIIEKQQGAIKGLNKASEFLRIKLDDEKVSSPPAIKKGSSDSGGSNGSADDDDDDDFIL